MSAEHVVVPVERCRPDSPVPVTCKPHRDRCRTCLGNGTRVVLDQAVKVKEGGGIHWTDGSFTRGWQEVSPVT